MEQHNLTLLILAAECSDIVWVPIASSEELLMDYAIRFAVEAGCINVVVTVCEAQKDAALEHMKKIGQKYSVSTAAITVDSRYNGSVNQIVAAEKEFSNSNYIVMNASCYFEKEAFETAARNLLEFHSSCMIGDMPKVELPHSIDKRYFTPYVRSIWWDWRVKKNMFGFTAEAVKMIVDRYKIELDLEDQGPKQVKYDSLEAKIPDIMRLDHKFITDFDMIDMEESFFQINHTDEAKYVYHTDGGLKKSPSEICFCEYTELFLYQTEHHTIAINFGAYARSSCNWGQEYLYFCMERPFDTGITICENHELFKYDFNEDGKYPHNYDVEKTQYSWETAMPGKYHDCKDRCISTLFFQLHNRTADFEYNGKWYEYIFGEKYPLYLDVNIQVKQFLLLAPIYDLKISDCPMLMVTPIFHPAQKTASDKADTYEADESDESCEQTEDETEAPEKEVIPPNINVQGNSVCIEIVQDLDEDEYEDVFDIPDEAKIIHYGTQGAFGTYSADGINLILQNGWHGQFDSNTKLKYFAYSFAYSDDGNIITSTEMMNETALRPKSIQNAPGGKATDICKLYCRVENGKILDRAEHFNDGYYSEFCGPFRMFQALDKNASILAAVVVTKESDFADFIEQTKKITTALKTKAIVFEVMKRYQPIDV